MSDYDYCHSIICNSKQRYAIPLKCFLFFAGWRDLIVLRYWRNIQKSPVVRAAIRSCVVIENEWSKTDAFTVTVRFWGWRLHTPWFFIPHFGAKATCQCELFQKTWTGIHAPNWGGKRKAETVLHAATRKHLSSWLIFCVMRGVCGCNMLPVAITTHFPACACLHALCFIQFCACAVWKMTVSWDQKTTVTHHATRVNCHRSHNSPSDLCSGSLQNKASRCAPDWERWWQWVLQKTPTSMPNGVVISDLKDPHNQCSSIALVLSSSHLRLDVVPRGHARRSRGLSLMISRHKKSHTPLRCKKVTQCFFTNVACTLKSKEWSHARQKSCWPWVNLPNDKSSSHSLKAWKHHLLFQGSLDRGSHFQSQFWSHHAAQLCTTHCMPTWINTHTPLHKHLSHMWNQRAGLHADTLTVRAPRAKLGWCLSHPQDTLKKWDGVLLFHSLCSSGPHIAMPKTVWGVVQSWPESLCLPWLRSSTASQLPQLGGVLWSQVSVCASQWSICQQQCMSLNWHQCCLFGLLLFGSKFWEGAPAWPASEHSLKSTALNKKLLLLLLLSCALHRSRSWHTLLIDLLWTSVSLFCQTKWMVLMKRKWITLVSIDVSTKVMCNGSPTFKCLWKGTDWAKRRGTFRFSHFGFNWKRGLQTVIRIQRRKEESNTFFDTCDSSRLDSSTTVPILVRIVNCVINASVVAFVHSIIVLIFFFCCIFFFFFKSPLWR